MVDLIPILWTQINSNQSTNQPQNAEEEGSTAPATTVNASQASSSTSSGEKRPRRAATGRKCLNVGQLSIVCKNPFSFLATFRVLQKRENQNQNNDFGKNHRATLHIFWILNLYGNETV